MNTEPSKIEKGIPIPEKVDYTFLSMMEVGDSVAVSAQKRSSFLGSSTRYGEANNKKFITRKYGDAYRCWRIK